MLSSINETWIKEFRSIHGRAPRVLHIGNIANNAYLNAKFLNTKGFECDVICYDYYHIMGCPEWEDAEFSECSPKDHFRPDWVSSGVSKFERPVWFAQGPKELCLRYLLARRIGDSTLCKKIWLQLEEFSRTRLPEVGALYFIRSLTKWHHLNQRLRNFVYIIANASDPVGLLRSRLVKSTVGFNRAVMAYSQFVEIVFWTLVAIAKACHWLLPPIGREVLMLPSKFECLFKPRKAIFGEALNNYAASSSKWRELLEHYDLVIGYATDGIYPLLAGKRPYIAFEHGTIRSIPFADDVQGQLCALTYRLADAVVITNSDNVVAAKKLELPRYRFVPHPINDLMLENGVDGGGYDKLHSELDSDFIVFHPARQHWESGRHPDWEKGNDFFLRGFAAFVNEVNPRACAVLVNWGASVYASKQLIDDLKIANRVRWIEPLPHLAMMRMIKASDAVADQFFLGAFGSTMPKALACGKPALLHLKIEAHKWCFPELPPVVNVQSDQQIADGLSKLYLDRFYYDSLCQEGRTWYWKWHSSSVVSEKLIDIFREFI